MKPLNITAAEMEIMQVIWNTEGTVTSNEIMAALPDKKLTTIVTLAGRLIEKGVLASEKTGRSHAHQYSALISEKEYKKFRPKPF